MPGKIVRIMIVVLVLACLAGCRAMLAGEANGSVIEAPAVSQTVVPNMAASGEESSIMPVTGNDGSLVGNIALLLESTPGKNTFRIVPVDAGNGKPAAGLPAIGLGEEIAYGFSRDRSQMAVISKGVGECRGPCLLILDLRTLEILQGPVQVDDSYSVWFMLPDYLAERDTLPIAVNSQTDTTAVMLLFSRSQGKVTARASLPANILDAAYTPGGDLAVRGIHTLPTGETALTYVALLDGSDLSVVWEKEIEELPMVTGGAGDHSNPAQGLYFEHAAAFSPDGSRLYFAAADQPLLVTVDFNSRSVLSKLVHRETGWLERLLALDASVVNAKALNGTTKSGAISPDGRFLYVVGIEVKTTETSNGEFTSEFKSLGLQVIETSSGRLVHEMATDASQVQVSPDGKVLLLQIWDNVSNDRSLPRTDVLDPDSWEVTAHLKGSAMAGRLLDGTLAWMSVGPNTGSSATARLYRTGEAEPSFELIRKAYVDWILIP